MKELETERLREIVKLADKLGWIQPSEKAKDYPIMQLSEVEKCLCAMVDDFELQRMRNWAHVSIPEAKVPFDPDRIAWKDCRNDKGPFQISQDQADVEHQNMLNFLGYAGGHLNHEGWFYWVFPDGRLVGRKQVRKETKP